MNDARRILITGLSSDWGGRLARVLEQDARNDVLIGVDTSDPRHELQRTEFVRVATDDGLLRRIIRAAKIDTIVDTRLITDAFIASPGEAHEVNVLGTYALLAAAGGTGSPVRKVVYRSSAQYYGANADDPAFFTEDMVRSGPPRTAIEDDVLLAERSLAEFAQDNPQIAVTVLRFAPAIGRDVSSSHLSLLSLPVIPGILGFDPRWQFIHEEDVIGVLAHAVSHDLPGPFNAAGDGVLALSEVSSLLGKPLLPVLPPWGTVFAAVQLRRLGLRMPVEVLRDLRLGRGLDNRRLKASGYAYRYTTREAVLQLRAYQRLRPLLGSGDDAYRYEREVEEFLRWSPSVQLELRAGDAADAAKAGARGAAIAVSYDELTEAELLEVIPSLDPQALQQLRDHEARARRRTLVLEALEDQLRRRGPG
jgi:UDP-glucose 4-epimerase